MKRWDESELDQMQLFASQVLRIPLKRVDPHFHPALPQRPDKKRPTVKQIIIPRRMSSLREFKKLTIKSSPVLPLSAVQGVSRQKAAADSHTVRELKAQSPRLKSLTLVEKGKECDRYRERNRRGKAQKEEDDLLGYSSDSMMMCGEMILMDLYDRSKKLQSVTRKKGYHLECLALSPRHPALQPSPFSSVHKRTDELKQRLSAVADAWGVRVNWSSEDSEARELDQLAGKLAQVSHRIGQETLRVLGNR